MKMFIVALFAMMSMLSVYLGVHLLIDGKAAESVAAMMLSIAWLLLSQGFYRNWDLEEEK